MIGVALAAEIIGCTTRRVQQLLKDNILKGKRLHAHAWLVDKRSAEKYARIEQSVGRPRGPQDSLKKGA